MSDLKNSFLNFLIRFLLIPTLGVGLLILEFPGSTNLNFGEQINGSVMRMSGQQEAAISLESNCRDDEGVCQTASNERSAENAGDEDAEIIQHAPTSFLPQIVPPLLSVELAEIPLRSGFEISNLVPFEYATLIERPPCKRS